jgi:hypothetical protein
MLFTTAALLCGCNIVGPAVIIIEGPPTVPAQFKLNPERQTVIFVDDRHNVLPKRSLRSVIANMTEQVLLGSELIEAGNLIDHRAAMRTAARESADEPLSVVEVGRRLGAEVVIYITFESFTITRDFVTVHPLSSANVTIYDTIQNQQLFPAAEGSFELRTSLPRKQEALQMLSIAERSEVERELASGVGLRLARLFFEYELDRDLTN